MHGKKMWHVRLSAVRTLAVLAPMLLLAGCGASHPHERNRKAAHAVEYLPGGIRTLVRRRLPEGYISIVAEQYEYGGKVYLQLSNHAEMILWAVCGSGVLSQAVSQSEGLY